MTIAALDTSSTAAARTTKGNQAGADLELTLVLDWSV
jgi:hypothetical protein